MREADRARPNAQERGYGPGWRKVRAEVLRAVGIPESEWPLWDVDHVPRYPLLGEDHKLYTLIPRKHGGHSSVTMKETRRGVKAAWRHSLPKPGELFPEAVYLQRKPLRWEDWGPA